MKRRGSYQLIVICILIIGVWIITHSYPVNALNKEGENRIARITLKSDVTDINPITEPGSQTQRTNNSLEVELADSTRQPSPYRPTIVFVDVALNTISQINLPEKTYNIAAEVILEWQDGRIGFTPAFKGDNTPLKYSGDDVKAILAKIWAPGFSIDNEIQPRETQNRSISIAPNGWVRVYEQFTDVVKFNADVHTFPFSKETLPLSIVSALDDRGSVFFSLRSFRFTSSDPAKQVIGRWTPEQISARTQVLQRLDSKLGFPEIVISVDVKHKPQYIIFNFFIPLFVIFIAAAAVTWIDPSKTASYSSPRLGGTITLILTTIALKLSLVREIPAVNYITLTDAIFGITVATLIVSLITSCAIIFWANEKGHELLSKRVHMGFRKLYPFFYIGCLSSILLFFFTLYK